MTLCAQRACGCDYLSTTLAITQDATDVSIDLAVPPAGSYPAYTFLSIAERDATITSPQEGMEAFIRSEKSKYRFLSGFWRLFDRPATQYPFIGLNMVLGAGGVGVSQYLVADGLVTAWGRVTFGGSGGPTAVPGIGLPLSPATLPGSGRYPAVGAFYDVSAGDIYVAGGELGTTGAQRYVNFYRQDGGGQFGVTPTNPFTWAAGDEIWGHIQYSLY